MRLSKEALKIQAGEVCIAIKCSDNHILDRLGVIYADFHSDKPADIFLELIAVESVSPEVINERAPSATFSYKDGTFHDSAGLLSVDCNLQDKTVRVRMEKQLLTQN